MHVPDAVRTLARDLEALFGPRLRALIVHGRADGQAPSPAEVLALVDGLSAQDLRMCADRIGAWHDDGLATPLIIPAHEFSRSLDVFPLEFGAIIADHVVVSGEDPFAGLHVDPAHLRQACEVQARSHLLHLREGFLETGGRADRVAALIVESAAPLAALILSVSRLRGAAVLDTKGAARDVEHAIGLPHDSFQRVVALVHADGMPGEDARQLFPMYLEGVERLVHAIDQWPS